MRKEADDIGPRAELDHWKKRMSRFNYLLDQIKGPNVKAVLGVLHAAQSKLIQVCLYMMAHWKKGMSRFNYLLDQIKGPKACTGGPTRRSV